MRISDWSSDVCSSDLVAAADDQFLRPPGHDQIAILVDEAEVAGLGPAALEALRRRFGIVPVSARMFLPAIDFADDAGFGDDMAVCVADMHVRRQLADASGLHHLFLAVRSEGHTSELQSLMRISYAVFCFKKKNLKNCISTGYVDV